MTRTAWIGAAVVAISIAVPAQAQVVGISSAVKNDVRIKKPGTPLPRPVMVKQRVAINDQVLTGVKSQLQLLLLDQSVFTVGANARLVIDRFVYDPNRGRSLGATVAKGAFRFMSGRPDRGNNSNIRTPVASIGIRGTILEGVVGESAALIAAGEPGVGRNTRSDPATASLIILRGPGGATQGSTIPGVITVTAGGKTVQVDRPGLAVYVPGPGRAPIGPFAISPRALMQVQALLYPSVADRLGLRGPDDNLGGDPDGVYYPPTQDGPTYPPPGGYRPGPYPPGAFPGNGNQGPGAGVPGFPLPNIPQGGPSPPRPQGNPQPAPNGGPANAAPPANNPPPANNNPPPGNSTPLNAAGAPASAPPDNPPPNNPPPSLSAVAPDNQGSAGGPNNPPPGQGSNDPPPNGKGKGKGKTGGPPPTTPQ
jgi:hypothetical protein